MKYINTIATIAWGFTAGYNIARDTTLCAIAFLGLTICGIAVWLKHEILNSFEDE